MTDEFGQRGISGPSNPPPPPRRSSSGVRPAGIAREEAKIKVEDEAVLLSPVSLIVERESGPIEVPGLQLRFEMAGLVVSKANGELIKLIPWYLINSIDIDDLKITPVDPTSTLITVNTEKRSHVFKANAEFSSTLAELLNRFISEVSISLSKKESGRDLIKKNGSYFAFAVAVIAAIVLPILQSMGFVHMI